MHAAADYALLALACLPRGGDGDGVRQDSLEKRRMGSLVLPPITEVAPRACEQSFWDKQSLGFG